MNKATRTRNTATGTYSASSAKLSSSEKKTVDRAAKKIVKQYGKTLKLLARE